MAVANKKELILLLRLRQVEKYLEEKIKTKGDSREDLQQLIILKNTIGILHDADIDATGVTPPLDEWGDLTEDDWHCCHNLLQTFMKDKNE
jgi:hypothetical protein|tara:strand:- start:559 stop:831 length:273 start_codon:yes stop_codon:yes gene_type:complete